MIGPDLLQTVAEYGDMETVTILGASRHLKLHYERSSLAPSLEKLQQRRNAADGFEAAFHDLISLIETQSDQEMSDEALMEAGLVPSVDSSWHSLEVLGLRLAATHSDDDSNSFESALESLPLLVEIDERA